MSSFSDNVKGDESWRRYLRFDDSKVVGELLCIFVFDESSKRIYDLLINNMISMFFRLIRRSAKEHFEVYVLWSYFCDFWSLLGSFIANPKGK